MLLFRVTNWVNFMIVIESAELRLIELDLPFRAKHRFCLCPGSAALLCRNEPNQGAANEFLPLLQPASCPTKS